MLINLIWLLHLAVGQPWEISQTGIFTPLDQNGYAVSDSLRFYLMDAKERCIRIFDSEGRFVKTIGGRGKGPGEFLFLGGIRLERNRLYGLDPMTFRLSIFDEEGHFISSHKAPKEMLLSFPYSAKVLNGWVYTHAAQKQIIWVDEGFENPTVLAEIPRGNPRDNGIIEVAAERPIFAASPDRGTLYIYPGKGKFEVQVYDVLSKKFKQPIAKDIPCVPFDKEFGEQRFQHTLSRKRSKRNHIQFKPKY